MVLSAYGKRRRPGWRPGFAALSLCTALAAPSAWAFGFDTGNPDLEVRWDNSLRYSLGWRAESIDPAFGNNTSYDETEHRFGRGQLMTNRLDLLSELDLTWQQRLGLRLSGAGWFDAAYDDHARTRSDTAFVPYTRLGNYNGDRYSSYTRRFTVGGAEFLDAFVFAKFDLAQVPLSLKLGQHTVYWGESLFTAFHGIAYSQSPLDGLKAANSPGITAKEIFLPLQQLSVQAQLSSTLSMAAQVYLDWKPNRLPEGGTYFGGADFLFNGPDRLLAGIGPAGPLFVPRGPAVTPDRQQGNWGLNLRWSPRAGGNSTIGLYYRKFDEKQPWAPLFRIDPLNPAVPADYHLAYARGTQLIGLSHVTTLGSVSVGSELSYRKGSALNSTSSTVVPPGLLDAGQGVDQGCATRSVWLLQVGFEPQWLQALPGMDVAVPFSLAYGLRGNGATLAGGNEGAYTYALGVRLDVRNCFQFTLKYNDSHARVQTADGQITGSNGNAVQNDHGWLSLSMTTSF